MKTIIKPGSVELRNLAETDRFLSADDNCVLGKLSVNWLWFTFHVASFSVNKNIRIPNST